MTYTKATAELVYFENSDVYTGNQGCFASSAHDNQQGAGCPGFGNQKKDCHGYGSGQGQGQGQKCPARYSHN